MRQFIRTGILCLLAVGLIAAGQNQTMTGPIKVKTHDTGTESNTQYMLGRTILEFGQPPDLSPGDIVEVSGLLDGKILTVETLEIKERGRRLDAPLVRAPMAHTTAILATSDSDITRNTALNAMERANAHWTASSRGYDTLVGGVFEKYQINYNNNDCSYNNADRIIDRLVAAFEQDGYDADDYDHILTIIPRSCGSWTGAWAYIGGITDGGQLRFAQYSMYKDNTIGGSFLIISHELGHNIGMNHAREMDCGSDPYYRPNGQGCSFDEYGNYNDNMGNGNYVYYSGPYQRYLGWIDAGRVITAGKTSDFNLQPVDDTFDCGIQVVRIPIPDEDGTYFYIEYRHVRNSSIYAGTGPANNKRNALLITRSRDGRGGNASSFTDRVDLGVNRYEGAEQGKRYNLGKGVAVRLRSMASVAKVSIEMPGNSNHRDDDGNVIPPQPDGTFGEIDCGAVEDPYIAMTKSVYEVNEQIEVRYFNLPDSDTNWIGVFNRGAGNDSALEWKYVQGATGTATFNGLPEGNYDARLFTADAQYEAQFRVEDVVVGDPRIEMSKNTYKEGEQLRVRYFDLPPTDLNWIGIYNKDAGQEEYLDWVYVDGAQGVATFAGRTEGDYEARLFFDDSYDVEFVVSFAIEGDEEPPTEIKCKKNELKKGKKLKPGQYICSKNGEYAFGLKTNGRLQLITLPDGNELWTAGTCCVSDSYLRMQKDGNLVHYSDDGDVLFASGTQGNEKAKLKIRNNGVAVILNKDKEVIWSTGDEPPPEDPYIEMSKNKYDVGEQIRVRFYNLPDDNFWVGLYADGAENWDFLAWDYAQGGSGVVTFDGLANAGDHEARLFLTGTYDMVYEVSFQVEGDEPPPEDPYIETNKNTYDVGEQINVAFFNLPPGDMHWIGLYNSGAGHEEYLVWEWAQGGTGSVDFDGTLSEGNYDARLFFDDSYDLEYEVQFKVEGDEPPPEGDVELTLNPYDGVNWGWTQYKANYHTHTTESDGSHNPATTIDQYYNADYKILAITDHNTITWPWTDYNRDPDALGMLAVKGDEYSNSHHMNAFFNFSKSSSNMETGVPHVESNGGLVQLNHPGRYSDEDDWAWYVGWYKDYDSLVVIEAINRTSTYFKLWDNINENHFEQNNEFVWGTANDDKHGSGDLFRAFQFMLMPSLTKSANMEAMRKGRFYFCSEPGGSGNARVPRISSIVVDTNAQTIKINASNANNIRWYGPGTSTVHTGDTFDYSDYTDRAFVRVMLDGSNGDCYTQPFGFVTRN